MGRAVELLAASLRRTLVRPVRYSTGRCPVKQLWYMEELMKHVVISRPFRYSVQSSRRPSSFHQKYNLIPNNMVQFDG